MSTETATAATYSPARSAGSPPVHRSARIRSIDVVRGAIMVLMAIDHVRVYSGLPAGGPTAGIFFTRWITHFCAPGFVFLAGTAAYLHGRKLKNRAALSKFLATRGLVLVVLELTIIRLSWTFSTDYSTFVLAGVIWMLGWCMVLLAAVVHLSLRTIGWIGVVIVALQQLFALVPGVVPPSVRPAFGRIWEFVYPAGLEAMPPLAVLYVLVPWIGVMAAGYGFGALITRDTASRDRLCLRIGIGATAAFLIAGGLLAWREGGDRAFVYRLLDQQKYPASKLYLLMTLGPMIALVPAAERMRGRLSDALDTVGRVPLFYYLLHIPLIHATALVVNQVRTGAPQHAWYATAPFVSVPEEQRWTLGLLYAVFVVDVLLLYAACRWYAAIKARRTSGWLRYL